MLILTPAISEASTEIKGAMLNLYKTYTAPAEPKSDNSSEAKPQTPPRPSRPPRV